MIQLYQSATSELRAAGRRLRARPAFAVAGVALLGGGVGIAVAAGSVAWQTLVRPMPYRDERGLVSLYWSRADLGIPDMSLSLLVSGELLDRSTAFASLAATRTPLHVALHDADGVTDLTAGLVSPSAFQVLGIEPGAGRAFTADEGDPGSAGDAIILSHDAASRLFAAAALGSNLVINGRPRTVVGVLPQGPSLAPEQATPIDVWFPLGAAGELLGDGVYTDPGARSFRVNARLQPGVTPEALAPELGRLAAQLAEDYPDTHAGWQLNADPLRERVLGASAGPVAALTLGGVLFGALALLNLGGLLYQGAQSRAAEIAIRRALGATTRRIRWLRTADALAVGGLGAMAAAAVVVTAFVLLGRAEVLHLPGYVTLELGWPQALAIALPSIGGAWVVGAVAGAVADVDAHARIAALGRGTRSPRPSRATLTGLASQVALSTALMVGAVATARSLARLHASDVGIDPEGLTSVRVDVPRERLPTEEVARRARAFADEVKRLPGIEDAFLWSPEIPTDAHTFTGVRLESALSADDTEPPLARYHSVSPGAIGALGLHVLAGRDMSDDDWVAGRRVALVSASAADVWWGGVDRALGQRLRRGSHTEWSEVIGVVADAPLSGRFGPGSDNTLDVFFMLDQDPRASFLLFAKGRGPVDVGALRSAAATTLPGVPLYDGRRMTETLRDQEARHRATAALSMVYALASIVLAWIGLAAATLVITRKRRLELGIRTALGATRGRAILELLVGSVGAVAAGVVAGLLIARVGLGWIDPVILTVGPADPFSHLVGGLVLSVAAVVALLVPALRSVGEDPARSLAELAASA